MEDLDTYLARKHRELQLISGHPGPIAAAAPSRSVDETIERKFRAGAALKAEQAHAAWAMTETRWADAPRFRTGPFEVAYTYQRADLAITAPPHYGALRRPGSPRGAWTYHTASGMAALAALFMALIQGGSADLAMSPDGYPETRQLAECYGQATRLVPVDAASAPRAGRTAHGSEAHVLLIDSGSAGGMRMEEEILAWADLVVFDTTCLEASSARIAAVLHRVTAAALPMVLVRSHTKLDSLGIEYGRLGSALGLAPLRMRAKGACLMDRLTSALPDAIRLLGAAAVPAHLPPFAGSAAWRDLSRQRAARIIRNNRHAAQALAVRLQGRGAVVCYRHGLFLTLAPPVLWAIDTARCMASFLASALRGHAMPVRHAGSFGFDFVGVDAFPLAGNDRCALRMAISDLPLPMVDAVTAATVEWWDAIFGDDGPWISDGTISPVRSFGEAGSGGGEADAVVG